METKLVSGWASEWKRAMSWLIEYGQANIKPSSSQNKAGSTNQGFYQAVVFYLSPADSGMWMQRELISSQDIKQFSSSFTVALWDS